MAFVETTLQHSAADVVKFFLDPPLGACSPQLDFERRLRDSAVALAHTMQLLAVRQKDDPAM